MKCTVMNAECACDITGVVPCADRCQSCGLRANSLVCAELCGAKRGEKKQDDPATFLEEASIQWKRDWDAVAVGFVVGVLAALAGVGLWPS
jgi:hypothetical protein